jgi:predicted enzyme related to lactoylglutathione lyase
MRLYAIVLVASLSLGTAAGASAASDGTDLAMRTRATPTTLPIETVPTTAAQGSTKPTATGKILMVKLYVGNLKDAEKFYGTVFGAQLAVKIGKGAHVVSFPDGGPLLALIAAGRHDKNKKGSFVVQVPDLAAAKKLAVANGAKAERSFAGNPAGQAAKSIDFVDPWGNGLEILQIGG